MQLQLSNEEQKVFESLARTRDGDVLVEFIERLIRHVESVRTQTTLSTDARIEVSNLLEKNFVDRFKLMRKQYDQPNLSEHE